MTHRERFYKAVTHGKPDRAACDLCGSPQTLVDYEETRNALCRELGITGSKQGSYCVDERILEALDIDTRLVGGMPTPKTAHCREENGIVYDTWGIRQVQRQRA